MHALEVPPNNNVDIVWNNESMIEQGTFFDLTLPALPEEFEQQLPLSGLSSYTSHTLVFSPYKMESKMDAIFGIYLMLKLMLLRHPKSKTYYNEICNKVHWDLEQESCYLAVLNDLQNIDYTPLFSKLSQDKLEESDTNDTLSFYVTLMKNLILNMDKLTLRTDNMTDYNISVCTKSERKDVCMKKLYSMQLNLQKLCKFFDENKGKRRIKRARKAGGIRRTSTNTRRPGSSSNRGTSQIRPHQNSNHAGTSHLNRMDTNNAAPFESNATPLGASSAPVRRPTHRNANLPNLSGSRTTIRHSAEFDSNPSVNSAGNLNRIKFDDWTITTKNVNPPLNINKEYGKDFPTRVTADPGNGGSGLRNKMEYMENKKDFPTLKKYSIDTEHLPNYQIDLPNLNKLPPRLNTVIDVQPMWQPSRIQPIEMENGPAIEMLLPAVPQDSNVPHHWIPKVVNERLPHISEKIMDKIKNYPRGPNLFDPTDDVLQESPIKIQKMKNEWQTQSDNSRVGHNLIEMHKSYIGTNLNEESGFGSPAESNPRSRRCRRSGRCKDGTPELPKQSKQDSSSSSNQQPSTSSGILMNTFYL